MEITNENGQPAVTGTTPGQAAPGDVVASLPRQWDAEADATAHWGDVNAPERAAYANALHDCASELRKALAAQQSQPAPSSALEADARTLEDAAAILRRRYGKLNAGDAIVLLKNRAAAIREEGK
jgi:hypothetical protein